MQLGNAFIIFSKASLTYFLGQVSDAKPAVNNAICLIKPEIKQHIIAMDSFCALFPR